MDAMSRRLLMKVDAGRLRRSLRLLLGFFVGCVVAAAAISLIGDWAWSFPVALAAAAVALPEGS
jgi:uncharacterized membrane protein YoaK (UPF0700 family)